MFKARFVLKSKKEFSELVNHAPRVYKQELVKGMKDAMLAVESKVKGDFLSGRRGSEGLNVQTGRLRSSITSKAMWVGKALVGIVGTNVVYARIHELGGHIYPKKAKALRLPLPHLLFGRASRSPSRTHRLGKFIFVKHVYIPKRSYLGPGFRDAMVAVMNIINGAVLRTFSMFLRRI